MLNKFVKRFMKVTALVLVVVMMLGVMPERLMANPQPTNLLPAVTSPQQILQMQDGFIYFGRPTCPACVAFEPTLQGVLAQTQTVVHHFNTDDWREHERFAEVIAHFGVQSVPAIVMVQGGNAEVIFNGQADNAWQGYFGVYYFDEQTLNLPAGEYIGIESLVTQLAGRLIFSWDYPRYESNVQYIAVNPASFHFRHDAYFDGFNHCRLLFGYEMENYVDFRLQLAPNELGTMFYPERLTNAFSEAGEQFHFVNVFARHTGLSGLNPNTTMFAENCTIVPGFDLMVLDTDELNIPSVSEGVANVLGPYIWRAASVASFEFIIQRTSSFVGIFGGIDINGVDYYLLNRDFSHSNLPTREPQRHGSIPLNPSIVTVGRPPTERNPNANGFNLVYHLHSYTVTFSLYDEGGRLIYVDFDPDTLKGEIIVDAEGNSVLMPPSAGYSGIFSHYGGWATFTNNYYRAVEISVPDNLSPGLYTVSVTVTETTPLGAGDDPAITSTSTGQFRIGPVPPETTTFTFTKQNHQSTPLAGATFQLFPRNATGDGWATTPQQTITSGSGNGNVTLTNLTHGGRYQLRETAAPTGFITPPAGQYWDISVSATGDITVTPVGGATAFGGAQPFTSASTTATLANQPQTINVPVLKIWDDSENDAGLRPTSIQVQLMRNGIPYPYRTPVTINATSGTGWQYTFTNLVRYNFDVTPPVPNYFAVVEIGVPAGYSVSYSGSMNTTLTITNHHPPLPPPTTINIPVTKVWAGDLPEGDTHPTSVQVQLLRNGQPHRLPVTLTAPGWTYEFTGLYRYVAGTTTRYTYTVVELNIPTNYSASYSGHMDTGLIVTNTFRPPSIVTLSKELRMPAGTQLPENEFSFNFQSQMVNFWPPRAQDQWPSASLSTLSAHFTPPVTTTIDGNYEYAIVNIPINLSAMQWTTPGIYTFRIWETPGSSNLTNPFTVEYDRSVFYIYVHVGREDGSNMSAPLVVLGINSSRRLAAESCYTTWPHPANDCACVPVPRAESEKWELPFVNHLTSSTTFEVGKILEGDMGDPNQPFAFTVTFTLPDYATAAHNIGVSATGFARNGILVGSVRSDLGLGANYVNLQPAGNTITIPAGSRTVTRTFNLRHGDIIEFTNIPIGTVSAVTETYFDNYIQSGVATGLSNVVISNTEDYIRISGQVYAAASVTITNTHDETPPTGVFLQDMPFGLMVALGAGALVATGAVAVVHSKKKKRR